MDLLWISGSACLSALACGYRYATYPVAKVFGNTVVETPVSVMYAKVAGVLGASAVVAAAYGSHGMFITTSGSFYKDSMTTRKMQSAKRSLILGPTFI